MAGDIFTLDNNANAAVRTVSVKAAASETNSPIIFTTDENGNAAVRVMGGAGSIDEDRIIIKSAEIPTASADEVGKMYCYDGETTSAYTHGYIYECVAGTPVYSDSVTFEPATLSGTVVTATTGALADLCAEYITGDITAITNGTMTYDSMSDLWRFVGKDANNNTVGTFQVYQLDYERAGFTFTGTPEEGDVVAFASTITETTTYAWERIDVQPAAKLGRYLSGWNCATGLATTNPQESPYEYTTGDYFIVSAVAAAGGTNYRPNGSSYVIGQASTTVESSVVTINDTYLYDGTNWTLLKTGSAVTSVNGQVGAVTITGDDVLPSQTGNSGKFLTTDGTNSSWSDKPLVNNATASTSVAIMGSVNAGGGNAVVIGKSATVSQSSVAIGSGSSANSSNATAVGYNAVAGQFEAVAIGMNAQANTSAAGSIALGSKGTVGANNACLINTSRANKTLSSAGVLEFCNGTGDYVLVNQDGTIPAARLTNALPAQTGHSGHVLGTDGSVAGWIAPEMVQRTAMPQASEEEVGNIYQFKGTTDANYTNGYFYKCVSDGATPTPAYSWERVDVQPGSSLPSQSGNSGKFLTTDGTDASWSDKPLVNLSTVSTSIYAGSMGVSQTPSYSQTVMLGMGATARDGCVVVGYAAEAWGYGVSIGRQAQANVNNGYSISIGYRAKTTAVHAIQLGTTGSDFTTNSDANTFKVANANGNFELMSADGTIPKARLANAATVPATAPELTVADWSSNTQTITVSGVTASNVVFVAPAPASQADYTAAGIMCTAQGTDSLTFTCTTVPSNAITLNVVIL